jgi:squalene synthase HpnC
MENLYPADYDLAYRYCKEISIRHYENFPVGSLLIPKEKRKYIYSIYAFARYADDIADSGKLSEKDKLKKLNELDNELTKIQTDNLKRLIPDTQNIFIALHDTISSLKIPASELRNLLSAFKQDSFKSSYESYDELLKYSEFSANPVGHLVLYIFGYSPLKDKEAFEYSDKICTALQLTNFWQDVSEDLEINRVYIPDELMRENNFSAELLYSRTENNDFLKIIKTLADRTKIMFNEGKRIFEFTSGRLRLELKATIAGGEEILKKIEDINYKVLSKKIKISNLDKIKIFGNIILK